MNTRNTQKYEVKFLKCLICNDDKNYGRLHKHLLIYHSISAKQYTIQYLYNDIEPICKCGCGYKTRYTQFSFKEFHKGHNANRKGVKCSQEHVAKLSISNKKRAEEDPQKYIARAAHAAQFSQTSEANEKRKNKMQIYWNDKEKHIKQQETMKQMFVDRPELKKIIAQKSKQWHASLTQKEKDRIWGEEWRNKISQSITNKYLEGGFEWSRGTYTSIKSKETFYYRSSWELRYMQQLDQDELVIDWNYEPFWIPYMKDGVKKRHIPDFLIHFKDGTTAIHEVGVKKLKEDIFSEKLQAAKDFCKKKGFLFKLIEFNF